MDSLDFRLQHTWKLFHGRSYSLQSTKHFQVEGGFLWSLWNMSAKVRCVSENHWIRVSLFTAEKEAGGGSRSTWFISDPNSAARSAVAPDNAFCWQDSDGVGMPDCQVLPVGRGRVLVLILGWIQAKRSGLQSHSAFNRTQTCMQQQTQWQHSYAGSSMRLKRTLPKTVDCKSWLWVHDTMEAF